MLLFLLLGLTAGLAAALPSHPRYAPAPAVNLRSPRLVSGDEADSRSHAWMRMQRQQQQQQQRRQEEEEEDEVFYEDSDAAYDPTSRMDRQYWPRAQQRVSGLDNPLGLMAAGLRLLSYLVRVLAGGVGGDERGF